MDPPEQLILILNTGVQGIQGGFFSGEISINGENLKINSFIPRQELLDSGQGCSGCMVCPRNSV